VKEKHFRHYKQTNPTTTTIIIIMATTQQQQGTGTGMKKLAEKPTLLGEKQQDKLKIHGRTLLEFEVGPATDKTSTLPSSCLGRLFSVSHHRHHELLFLVQTWTNWTGGCGASRPRALTSGLCVQPCIWHPALPVPPT
jgi:hypothetical protein